MICDKNLCTGCTACYNICPKNAIKMKENEEGFLYPEIDKNKCINCDLCKKICPINNNIEQNKENIEVYAATAKDNNILMNSSSGGMFTIIAEPILEMNGYVYGSIFDEHLNVVHKCINSKQELIQLRGSKYVQSNLKNIFKDVKEKLKNNNYVLFSGTPCQIAGLKSFLGREYDKLYTIDLICHGVPSQKIFDKYIKFIGKGKKITEFKFRDKEKKDTNIQILSYYRGNKKIKIRNPQLDPYYNAFFSKYIFRESCYRCKFANTNRIGDFTLGDFWGVQNYHKEFKNNRGVSAIILNTKKAKDFFECNIKNKINFIKTDIDYIKEKNHNLNSPNDRPNVRNEIYKDLNEEGFKYIVKKFLTPEKYLLIKLKSYIPLKIKQKLLPKK